MCQANAQHIPKQNNSASHQSITLQKLLFERYLHARNLQLYPSKNLFKQTFL